MVSIDGHASVIDEDVPADQEDQVNEAVMSCPERAIAIVTTAEARS